MLPLDRVVSLLTKYPKYLEFEQARDVGMNALRRDVYNYHRALPEGTTAGEAFTRFCRFFCKASSCSTSCSVLPDHIVLNLFTTYATYEQLDASRSLNANILISEIRTVYDESPVLKSLQDAFLRFRAQYINPNLLPFALSPPSLPPLPKQKPSPPPPPPAPLLPSSPPPPLPPASRNRNSPTRVFKEKQSSDHVSGSTQRQQITEILKQIKAMREEKNGDPATQKQQLVDMVNETITAIREGEAEDTLATLKKQEEEQASLNAFIVAQAELAARLEDVPTNDCVKTLVDAVTITADTLKLVAERVRASNETLVASVQTLEGLRQEMRELVASVGHLREDLTTFATAPLKISNVNELLDVAREQPQHICGSTRVRIEAMVATLQASIAASATQGITSTGSLLAEHLRLLTEAIQDTHRPPTPTPTPPNLVLGPPAAPSFLQQASAPLPKTTKKRIRENRMVKCCNCRNDCSLDDVKGACACILAGRECKRGMCPAKKMCYSKELLGKFVPSHYPRSSAVV